MEDHVYLYSCRVLSDFYWALLTGFNTPYRMPTKTFPMYKERSKDAVGGADMQRMRERKTQPSSFRV